MSASPEPATDNQQPITARRKRGPKTPEGKQRSSMNALKHGLTAKAPHVMEALEQHTHVRYNDCLQTIREVADPVGAAENTLVRQIARRFWHYLILLDLNRQIVAHILASDTPVMSLRALARYERSLRRRINRDMAFFKGRWEWKLANSERFQQETPKVRKKA